MKITICGSSAFKEKKVEFKKQLQDLGHTVFIHPDYEAFVRGEKQDIWKRVENGEHAAVKHEQGYIKWYYNSIKESDAVLILNFDKKEISGYIGGNTFLEMGFAYVLHKKIFLLNAIPQMAYTDEIEAMQPVTLNGDISKLPRK